LPRIDRDLDHRAGATDAKEFHCSGAVRPAQPPGSGIRFFATSNGSDKHFRQACRHPCSDAG
jgi:hypothetical protein